MIIQVDQEGRKVIEQLCDIALKQGGVKNLNQVNSILRSVTMLPPPIVKGDDKPKSLKKEDEKTNSVNAKKKEESKKTVKAGKNSQKKAK